MKSYRQQNREKYNSLLRKWRKENPERDKEMNAAARQRGRFKTYGLSKDQFDSMLSGQHGKCALCGVEFSSGNLVIDHDHRTGAVRALLCQKCNRGLGCFNDDWRALAVASEYVRGHLTALSSLSKPSTPTRPPSPLEPAVGI